MAKFRIDRINEEIKRAISEILPEIKDPRVRDSGMLTVTHVDTSGDLSQSKIYVSLFGTVQASDSAKKQLLLGLRSSAGFIRRELGSKVLLRITPELIFIIDDSLDRGQKILNLINDTMEKENRGSGEGNN